MSGTPADRPAGFDDETDSEFEVRTHQVSHVQHLLRLDRVLAELAPEFSRNHLKSLIERGHVWVGGLPVDTPARKVKAGQDLRLQLVPPAESLAFRPESVELNVVFEDEHLLVINKPAGLVVHPAAGNWSGTLLNGLLHRDPSAACLPRAGIVHRLDKETTGLMVVGRTLEAVTALVRDLAARQVRRRYMALVEGEMPLDPFTVEAPIGRDSAQRVRMAVSVHGKPARTDVFPVASAEGLSAVRCALHTGRTHQIRVHLSHVGHPLVGDALYGGRCRFGMTRQALHAEQLGFVHPATGQAVEFHAPPPDDLAHAWSQIATA